MNGEYSPAHRGSISRRLSPVSDKGCRPSRLLQSINKMRSLTCWVATSCLLLIGWGCDSIQKIQSWGQTKPNLVLHDGKPITLITTKFAKDPSRLYGSSKEYVFNFHFDPLLVELANIEAYALWTQDREGGDWQKIQTSKIIAGPMRVELPSDGVYGLRASVIYKDGREICVPSRFDGPLVWLHVDRQPPQLYWITPSQDQPLPRNSNVSIRWGVSEMEFENKEITVSQSSDGGRTWHSIEILKGRNGEQFASWKTPEFGKESVWLKVSTEDFVGNTSEIKRLVKFEKPQWGTEDQNKNQKLATQLPQKNGNEQSTQQKSKTLVSQNPNGKATADIKNETQGTSTQLKPISYRQNSEEGNLIGPPKPPLEVKTEGTPKKIDPQTSKVSIQLKNLQDGRTFAGGIARYLFFTVEGLSPDTTMVQAQLKEAAGEWLPLGVHVLAKEGKILWKLPERSIEKASIRLLGLNRATQETVATSDVYSISVDHEAPHSSIIGFPRQEDGSVAIRINVTDRGPAGIDKVILHKTLDGGQSWQAQAIEDASKLISLKPERGPVGFYLQAIDKVGHDTGAPSPGTKPQKTLDAIVGGVLKIVDLPQAVIKGGTEVTCMWDFQGPIGDETLSIDISPNGIKDWRPLGESIVKAQRKLLIVPAEDSDNWVLRLRLKLADSTFLTSKTQRFAIDSSAPQIILGQVPRGTKDDLQFTIRMTDPGKAQLAELRSFVKPKGEKTWRRLPIEAVSYDKDKVTLRLDSLEEGIWECALQAMDSVGNLSLSPESGSTTEFQFYLDRTPPQLQVQATAFPWVEGYEATVEVQLDRSDAEPPLVLEGRGESGGWKEVHRWESLPPNQDLFSFKVPKGVSSYALRFSIQDRMGNSSRAHLGPRPIESAMSFIDVKEGKALKAGETIKVRWKIHSALMERKDELRVSVSHREGLNGEWSLVCDSVPVDSMCAWSAPTQESQGHYLRARLFLRGEAIAEAQLRKPYSVLSNGGRELTKETPQAKNNVNVVPTSSKEQAIQLSNWHVNRAELQLSALLKQIKAFRKEEAALAKLETIPPNLQSQLNENRRMLVEHLNQVKKNFTDAYKHNNQNTRASFGLAKLERALNPNAYHLAIPWLKKTLNIDPNHTAALNDLGASYIRQKNYIEAEKTLLKAYKIVYNKKEAEKHPGLLFNCGQALFFRGKYQNAKSFFGVLMTQRSEEVPNSKLCYYYIACFVQLGEKEKALQYLNRYESYMTEKNARILRTALNS